MYSQTTKVKFHQMDKTAQQMAKEIRLLTRRCDPKNLVIMCGEYHCQIAHRYFTNALTQHVNRDVALDGFLQELPDTYQPQLKLHFEIAEATNNLSFATRSLAGDIRYNYTAVRPSLSAHDNGIPSYFIDMPDFRDADNMTYVDPLHKDLLDSELLRNLMNPYKLFMQHGHHVSGTRDAIGLERRDLYMAHKVCDIQKESPVVLLNGKGHLSDGPRKTLANMLIESGKEIVMVDLGVEGVTDKPATDFLAHVPHEKMEQVIALFCPVFPKMDMNEGLKECEAQWRALDDKNKGAKKPAMVM